MTPHFCLPARHGGLQHTTPAGTSRPRRGRRAAEAEKTRISPGRPLSPRRGRRQRAGRCPRSPPRRLRGPPRGEPGVSPSSRPCRGRGGSTSRGGHGRRRPPTPHASPRAGRRRREKRAAAAAGSFPPAPPSRPFTSAAASCACSRSGRRAAGDRGRPGPAPHRLAPASPLTSVPAHAQARPAARPPLNIAAAEGRGGAGRGPPRRSPPASQSPAPPHLPVCLPALRRRASRDAGRGGDRYSGRGAVPVSVCGGGGGAGRDVSL